MKNNTCVIMHFSLHRKTISLFFFSFMSPLPFDIVVILSFLFFCIQNFVSRKRKRSELYKSNRNRCKIFSVEFHHSTSISSIFIPFFGRNFSSLFHFVEFHRFSFHSPHFCIIFFPRRRKSVVSRSRRQRLREK